MEGAPNRRGPSEILWNAPQNPTVVEEAGKPGVFRTSASLVSNAHRVASQRCSAFLELRTSSGVVQEYAVVGKRRSRRDLDSFLERHVCSKGRKAQKHQLKLMEARKMAQEALEIGKVHLL